MNPDNTIYQIRLALTEPDKTKRNQIIGDDPEILSRAKELWHGGSICGQCEFFSQLGGRGSGLCGVCKKLITNDYLKPESAVCRGSFSDIKENIQ